jgi:hypothetical protein
VSASTGGPVGGMNGGRPPRTKVSSITIPVEFIIGPLEEPIETKIRITGALLESLLRRRAWITTEGTVVTIHLADYHDQAGGGATLIDALAKLALT